MDRAKKSVEQKRNNGHGWAKNQEAKASEVKTAAGK